MPGTHFSTMGPGAPGHLLDFNRLQSTWAYFGRGCGHGLHCCTCQSCTVASTMLHGQAAPKLDQCKLLQRCHCMGVSSSHHRGLQTFFPLPVPTHVCMNHLWRPNCTHRCALPTSALLRHSHQVQLEVLSTVQVLREWHFDWQFMVRGLIIDKRRGNMLKVDRHKYVKLAFHGFTPLSREQRLATYAESKVRLPTSAPPSPLSSLTEQLRHSMPRRCACGSRCADQVPGTVVGMWNVRPQTSAFPPSRLLSPTMAQHPLREGRARSMTVSA